MAALWKYKQVFTYLGNFEQLLRKNLWKDLPFLWHISKFVLPPKCSQNFTLKIFFKKKRQFFENVNKFLQIQQLWTTFARKLMKRPTIFMTYFHSSDQFVHVHTVLLAQKFLQKKWHLFQYVKKMLLIPATLNNILNKNYEKFYRFCNIFSKFLSLFTLSHNVIMATFLEQKWQLFQCC